MPRNQGLGRPLGATIGRRLFRLPATAAGARIGVRAGLAGIVLAVLVTLHSV